MIFLVKNSSPRRTGSRRILQRPSDASVRSCKLSGTSKIPRHPCTYQRKLAFLFSFQSRRGLPAVDDAELCGSRGLSLAIGYQCFPQLKRDCFLPVPRMCGTEIYHRLRLFTLLCGLTVCIEPNFFSCRPKVHCVLSFFDLALSFRFIRRPCRLRRTMCALKSRPLRVGQPFRFSSLLCPSVRSRGSAERPVPPSSASRYHGTAFMLVRSSLPSSS